MTERSAMAAAMFDRRMRYVAASPRWLQDYGLTGQPVVGRRHYELFPELPDRWRRAHQAGLAGQACFEDCDCFVGLDGEPAWLRWELDPWRLADGSVGGIVLVTEPVAPRLGRPEPEGASAR